VGRVKTINRESVLDAVESVILQQGISGLSVDAVAKAAGITKGGVQSCFGTKESMVEAMLKRYLCTYESQKNALSSGFAGSEKEMMVHVELTGDMRDINNSRTAALMAALLQFPQYLVLVNQWYQEKFRLFSSQSEKTDEDLKLLFFATEGIFFLKHFGLMEITEDQWMTFFSSVKTRLGGGG